MTGVEILEAWYNRVWVQADLDAVAEYFDVDALASGLMSDFAAELEDFQTLVPAILRLVRDVNVTLEDSMEDGDKAWARATLHAKAASTMEDVSISGQVMIRVKNGKIIEAHNHFDFIGFFEKLGNLPQDTIAICLSGEELS